MDLLADVDSKFWSKGRVETFTHWPYTAEDGTCTRERMAAAGFHFIGSDNEPDAVECFICAKQLDGWDAEDDPFQEHAKHQKDCPYVVLNKQDELQWTIDDLFTLLKTYYINKLTRTTEEAIKNVKLQSQAIAKEIPKIYKHHQRKSRKIGK